MSFNPVKFVKGTLGGAVVGGSLGSLLGGLGGGGGLPANGGNVTTVTMEPPAYLKPYLTDILNQAKGQYYGQPPQYYPGSTVAGFSPTSQQAMGLATQRALNGSPVNAAASNQLTNTLNGNYLYGNPGFNAAYQAAASQIIPQVGSVFGGANRLHSGLAQTAVAQGLGNAFAGLYGQERNNQLQAAAFAPQAANQSWTDIGHLAAVGGLQDVMNQNQLSDQVNRFNYNQNLPFQQLQRYAGFANGIPNSGGTQTTQAPQPGMLQSILGGGMAGAGLGQMLGASGAALGPYALGGVALAGLLS